jgi:uncharacterized protein with HEPN domain
MKYEYSSNRAIALSTLLKMKEACDLIIAWNETTKSADDYRKSPEGQQKLAASCMMIESIGEGVKKIDQIMPNFLVDNAPEIPWQSVKGMRDHIAHAYFNIDADIVFDVVDNEINPLRNSFAQLIEIINC